MKFNSKFLVLLVGLSAVSVNTHTMSDIIDNKNLSKIQFGLGVLAGLNCCLPSEKPAAEKLFSGYVAVIKLFSAYKLFSKSEDDVKPSFFEKIAALMDMTTVRLVERHTAFEAMYSLMALVSSYKLIS